MARLLRIVAIALLVLVSALLWLRPRVLEGLDNPASAVAKAIQGTCQCPDYDPSLNNLQEQVDALNKKVQSTIDETKENLNNVGKGISANING